ncbi:hypothetical protein [Paenibacillus sp. OV219]|uniref:hypothetical protein n=1 Tax=Paenibacillus sp. OV219 TaxID=1884377 RepID=UPI0008B947E9|nr:hypothetical protein [Paenibacillus sp. OV219]SEP18628.1 hypothetical protein SAMN05518847_1284 [Paenibacillus sp. OV219]
MSQVMIDGLNDMMKALQDEYDECSSAIGELTQKQMEIASQMAEMGQKILQLEKEILK